MQKQIGLTPHKKALKSAFFSALATLLLVTGVFFTYARVGEAAINEQMQFQARLLTAGGSLVPDGDYHVRFRIYTGGDGALGGGDETLEWTETHSTGNLVSVTNGYVSAQLGSITAFGTDVDWNSSTLWLSMEVGGTGGSPSWDGEMDPFIRLSSTPYAFNAGQLEGRDADQFVQLDPGASAQTVSSANIAINVNQTGAGGLITLQSGGTTYFEVDNSGSLQLGAYDCSGNANGGALTADASGNITCTDDDGGAGGSGVDTVGTIDSQSKSSDGAVISGTSIYLQTADASNPGLVSNGVQVLSGAKTFQDALTVGVASTTDGSLTFLNATNSFSATLDASNQTTGNVTISFPDTGATTTDTICLLTTGNCVGGGGGGAIGGSGTLGTIALFTPDGNNIGDSVITQSSGDITVSGDLGLAAGNALRIIGGNTASRPGAPAEGQVYFDTDTNSLISYANGKWQADRTDAILVAANDSTQAEKDAADYVADGTSDEDEINSALTVAAGGKVVLLPGTYVADETILIPNNTTLAGAGNGSEIQFADIDVTDNLIENSDTTTGTGVVIRDLALNGRDDLNTANNQTAMYLNGLGAGSGTTARTGGEVSNVYIENFRRYGIQLNNSDNNAISNITTIDMQDDAIYLLLSEYNTISETISQGVETGIYLDDSSYNTISDNVIADSDYGIYLLSDNLYNTISGNIISNTANEGIYLIFGSNYNTIDGNTVESVADTGIYVQNSIGVAVSGNLVDANSVAGSDGIWIAGTSPDSVASGNTIRDVTGMGVYVESSDNVVVDANTVNGTGNFAIYVWDSDNGVVSDNSVINPDGATDNHGIVIDSSDYISVTSNRITDGSCTTTCEAIQIFAGSDFTYLADNTFLNTGVDTAVIADAGTNTIYANQRDSSGNLETLAAGGAIEFLSATNVLQGSLSVGEASTTDGTIVFYDASSANAVTLATQNLTGNVTYEFEDAAAGTYQVCTSAGNCVGVGGGAIGGSGTLNRLALFTPDGNNIGDSSIRETGTGAVRIDNSSNSGEIQFNAIDGAIELLSGDNADSYLDFKGSTNLGTDYQGRLVYTDGVGFALNSAAGSGGQLFVREDGTVRINNQANAVDVFQVQDNGTNVFRVLDGGGALFQNSADSTAGLQILDADGGTSVFSVDTTNERVGIGVDTPSVSLEVIAANDEAAIFNSGSITGAGEIVDIRGSLARGSTGSTYGSALSIAATIDPTSGSSNLSFIDINGTVNSTGAATGIERGVYVRPTLTSANDFRAIDLANNSGFGIYQSGASAENYFAGNVGIGTLTPDSLLTVGSAEYFQVSGSGRLGLGVSPSANDTLFISTTSTADRALALRAVASQTEDIQQLQNSGGTVLSGFDATGDLFYENSTFRATLEATTLTDNRTITLPDAAGTVCLTSGNCAGVAGNSLQQAYVAGSTIVATDAEGDIDLTVSEATNFSVDITGTGSFLVQDGGSNVLEIADGSSLVNVLGDVTANTTDGAVLTLGRDDTNISPSNVFGSVDFYTNDGSDVGVGARISGVAESTTSDAALVFYTGNPSALNEVARFDERGVFTVTSNGNNNSSTAIFTQDDVSSDSTLTLRNAGTGTILDLIGDYDGTPSTVLTVDGLGVASLGAVGNNNSYGLTISQDDISGGGGLQIRSAGTTSGDTLLNLQGDYDGTPYTVLSIGADGVAAFGDATTAGVITLSDGSSNTATIRTQALAADVIYEFTDESAGTYQICTSAGNCSGVAGNNLQQAYEAGNTIVATDAEGDIDLTVSEATNFTVDITGTGEFAVQDGGTNALAVADGGNVTIGNVSSGAELVIGNSSQTEVTLTKSGVSTATLNFGNGSIVYSATESLALNSETSIGFVTDSGSTTAPAVSVLTTGELQAGNGSGSIVGEVRFNNGVFGGSNAYVALRAPSGLGGTDRTFTLPNAYGTSGYCLTDTDGAGTLGFADCNGGATAVTLQNAYTGGNTVTTGDGSDIDFTLADTTTDSNFIIDIATGSTSFFGIQNNGTDVVRYDTTNGFSVSSTGANSEAYGSGATTDNARSLAVGDSATATGLDSVAIGYNADGSANRSVAIGSGAFARGDDVAIGQAASTTGGTATTVGYSSDAGYRSVSLGYNTTSTNNGIAIGYNANAGAGVSVAIGTSAVGSGDSVAIGSSASTSGGSNAVALGRTATAGFNESIAIGANAATTASGQLVFGGNTREITQVYIGEGVTNATPQSNVTINATGASGTDISATDLTLAAGRSTGTGTGGDIFLQTAPSGGTGSTLNSLVTRFSISSDGTVSIPGLTNCDTIDTDGSGNLSCGTDDSGSGTITLQDAYDNGNTIVTSNNSDISITLADTATDSDFVVNVASGSSSQFVVQNNGTNQLVINTGGIDLLDVDLADFGGATVTFDAGEIVETEIDQNSLDDSEIQDNSLSADSLATGSVDSDEIVAGSVDEDKLNISNSDTAGYLLSADGVNGFTWVDPNGVGSDTFTSVEVDGVAQSLNAPTLNFNGTDFFLSESPADDFAISLQAERIEDIVGAMVTGNTETGVTVSYQDGDGTFDFVVDNLQDLAGTLDIASGGTGASSSQGAINALSQLTTNGDLLYFNGTNSTRLARGADGQCLTSNTTTIVWGSCSGGSGITGSGAANQVAYFDGTSTITSGAGFTYDGADLNVDSNTLFVDGSADRVGIGTASPSTELEIVDTSWALSGSDDVVFINADADPSAASTADYNALQVTQSTNNANLTSAEIRAISADIRYSGTGTVEEAIGLRITGGNNSTGTIDQAFALRVQQFGNGSGTITDNIGIAIDDRDTGTNNINLFIDASLDSAPNANYSIYNSSAYDNYFAGNFGIGDSTPDARLDIEDAIGNGEDIARITGSSNGTTGLAGTTQYLELSVAPSAASTGNFRGQKIYVTGGETNNENSTIYGQQIEVSTNEGSQVGILIERANYSSSATSDLTTSRGIWVGSTYVPDANPTLITDVGVQIGEPTEGTNNTALYLSNSSNFFSTPTGTYALYSDISQDSYLAGDLGIGDSSPDGKLEVRQTAAADILNLYDNTTNVFSVQDGGLVRVGSGGTAGLATTNGDLYIQDSLEIDGSVDLGDGAADSISFNGEVDTDIIPDADDTYDLGSSTRRWQDVYIGPATLNIGTDGDDAQISYDTSVDVLNINRQGQFETSTNAQLTLNNSSTGQSSILFGTGGVQQWQLGNQGTGSNDFFLWDSAAGNAVFNVGDNNGILDIGNTARQIRTNYSSYTFNNSSVDADLIVNSDTVANAFFVEGSTGNVGIGTGTPAAWADLDVSGNAQITGDAVVGNARAAANGYYNFGATTGSTGYGIRDNAGTIEVKNSGGSWNSIGAGLGGSGAANQVAYFSGASTLTSSANLFFNGSSFGVGTSSPDREAQIEGNDGAAPISLRVSNAATSGDAEISFEEAGQGDNFLITYDGGNNELEFSSPVSATTNLLVIERDGSGVGIGNNTPAYNLDVTGTGRFTSTLRVGSTLTLDDVSGASRITSTSDGGYAIFVDSDNNGADTNRAIEVRSNTPNISGGTVSFRVLQNGNSDQAGVVTVNGSGNNTFAGQLRVTSTQDVGLNANGSLVIGSGTDLNIAIDNNEIAARNNSAAAQLNLNIDGGAVRLGPNLYANGAYLDDDSTAGGNNDDWVRLNGYVEVKSNTDSYGIVLRDTDSTSYLGLTQVGGASYLTDSSSYTNYFIQGDGANARVRGSLITGSIVDVNDTGLTITSAYLSLVNNFDNNIGVGDTNDAVNVSSGNLNLGANDSRMGSIDIYGPSTGDEGGEIRLFQSAPQDTLWDYWIIDSYQDEYRVFQNDGTIGFYLATDSARPYFPNMNTTASGNTVRYDGSGQLLRFTSSERYKNTIVDLSVESNVDDIYNLRPVIYTPNNLDTNSCVRCSGFIAEEVNQVFPELVTLNEQGIVEAVDYERITSRIVAALIDQNDTDQQIEADILAIQNQLTNNSFANLNVSGLAAINDLSVTGSLTVTGTATLASLDVQGDVTIGGNLAVSGTTEVENIIVNGKIITDGDAPTVANGAVLGALDVTAIDGNDTAGTLSITIDATSIPVDGELVEVTFDTPFDEVPRIALTPLNADALDLPVFIEKTTDGFKLITNTIPSVDTTYEFDYIVIQ